MALSQVLMLKIDALIIESILFFEKINQRPEELDSWWWKIKEIQKNYPKLNSIPNYLNCFEEISQHSLLSEKIKTQAAEINNINQSLISNSNQDSSNKLAGLLESYNPEASENNSYTGILGTITKPLSFNKPLLSPEELAKKYIERLTLGLSGSLEHISDGQQQLKIQQWIFDLSSPKNDVLNRVAAEIKEASFIAEDIQTVAQNFKNVNSVSNVNKKTFTDTPIETPAKNLQKFLFNVRYGFAQLIMAKSNLLGPLSAITNTLDEINKIEEFKINHLNLLQKLLNFKNDKTIQLLPQSLRNKFTSAIEIAEDIHTKLSKERNRTRDRDDEEDKISLLSKKRKIDASESNKEEIITDNSNATSENLEESQTRSPKSP